MYHSEILNHITNVLDNTPTDSNAFVLTKALNGFDRIFLDACGRSNLVARFFAMRLMHLGYNVYVVGDTTTPRIGPNDLLLCISGSGETQVLINHVHKANDAGAHSLTITSNKSSTLAFQSTWALIIGPSYDYKAKPSSMPMGTVFELSALIFLESVISHVMDVKGIDEENMKTRHTILE